jgi:hypothetical protein
MGKIVRLPSMGLDFARFRRSLRGVPKFLRDMKAYRAAGGGLPLQSEELFPCLADYQESAGSVDGHYWSQDIWAAKKIHRRRPAQHVDIGSRLDGFVSHLLACEVPVLYVDVRALPIRTPGLTFVQDDATHLAQFLDNSVESLSSLHVAEHFGLGRYSDPIDPLAHLKFMSSLQRVLARGGWLYFSLPMGRERVQFNAHRILSPQTVLKQFDQLRLASFSFVNDVSEMHEDVPVQEAPTSLSYGCGMFEFTKE